MTFSEGSHKILISDKSYSVHGQFAMSLFLRRSGSRKGKKKHTIDFLYTQEFFDLSGHLEWKAFGACL